MAASCDRLVSGLRAAGITVDVAHLSTRHARVHVERELGGELLRIPLGEDGPHALNRLWLKLAQRRDTQPHAYSHVVAFGGELPLRAGPAFSAWLSAPLFVLLRGNDLDVGVFSARGGGALDRAVSAASGVGVVTTEHLEKVRGLWPTAPVSLMPNGIDVDAFVPLKRDREAAARYRAQVPPGPGPGRLVIGLVGELKAKKGAAQFIAALSSSGHAGRVHLRLVGEVDADVDEALANANANSGDDHFSFTVEPFRDRLGLLEVYASLDFVALPSLYDGLPNVLLEAMAVGVPVLGTRVGGMADVVDDGVSGVLFDADDDAAVREGLLKIVALSDDERRAMGEAARAAVLAGYTSRHELDRYMAFFTSDPDTVDPSAVDNADVKTPPHSAPHLEVSQ
jgi:glycosyltransferase involved in cell wall biosynthesis